MNKFKRFILLSMFVLLVTTLFACGTKNSNDTTSEITTLKPTRTYPEVELTDDLYRNYYEIFVYSFADTDGDGIGDLNGVTQKLDYIKDLGFNGIWLMPINVGTSYHKYDVENYYDIDPQFGTLDDFKNLLKEAHARGINILMDLVVNHSSSRCSWFKDAVAYIKENGEVGGEYGDYYNFSSSQQTGYHNIYGTSFYYEGRFQSGMPDLNLDSENVREEIKNIMKFWLDMGVDGFRLDACTSFYTNNDDLCIDFLDWLNTEAKKIKSDCYLVGEVWYSSNVQVNKYYNSGCDSFFTYPIATGEGSIADCLKESKSNNGQLFNKMLTNLRNTYSKGILAPFISNHDNERVASFLSRSKINKIKMAQGLLCLMNGAMFVYYGEEVGMSSGGSDPSRRIAIKWDTDGNLVCTKNPDDVRILETYYPYQTVDEQMADYNSIWNYYKAALYMRNSNPEIARGVTNVHGEYIDQSPYVSVFDRVYNDSTITIFVNLNFEETQTIVLNDAQIRNGMSFSLVTDFDLEVTFDSETKTLTLPPYSIAIFK